ncbi:MAG: metalloregulator ArsR/SmtB family transcription factor [Acidobacteriia bacterium]|nr:metalloregulator ArsR/SmtB family transcription factor [Terriglobia bacterium]
MKDIVKVFKALSDTTRLRILHLLEQTGELCVCDLKTVLECPQARISRHLAILKNAGFIDDRREGTWVLYSLTKAKGPIQPVVRKAFKQIVAVSPDFGDDKQRLRQALAQGRCKTFQVVHPRGLSKPAPR